MVRKTRRTRRPYEVLVSELMLQLTQVSRVVTKYGEFLGKFPTLADVARARPARVTEAWEGLGYYRVAWWFVLFPGVFLLVTTLYHLTLLSRQGPRLS